MGIDEVKNKLLNNPSTWLITGVAGFIGSNLLEGLLKLGQNVNGLDDFSTGHKNNLKDVQVRVGEKAWKHFTFIEGDISSIEVCRSGCANVNFILHHAALASVPRSIEDPIATNQSNVNGFVNLLTTARDAGVTRFVYAGSSAVYGNSPGLPKVENDIAQPLSPYALTKYINELYAKMFALTYKMECIGLRYFNVFGPRQDPDGAYAAVIPRWISELINGTTPTIYGDGQTTRDFCFIDNVFQANLLAATTENPEAINKVYNIACGTKITLNELYQMIRDGLIQIRPNLAKIEPRYEDFRPGDVRHSQADISKAKQLLGYTPTNDVSSELIKAVEWLVENM